MFLIIIFFRKFSDLVIDYIIQQFNFVFRLNEAVVNLIFIKKNKKEIKFLIRYQTKKVSYGNQVEKFRWESYEIYNRIFNIFKSLYLYSIGCLFYCNLKNQ